MTAQKKHPIRKPMGRPEYWTQERIAALEESLWEHVNDDDSVDVLEWRGKQRLTYKMLQHIFDKSEDFRSGYEAASAIMGAKRQKMGLTGKWNAQLVAKDEWMYNHESRWWIERMRDKDNQPAQNPASLKEASEIEQLKAKIADLEGKLEAEKSKGASG